MRLLHDQTTKLNALLSDLIRLEATGKQQESKSEALEWLADSKAAAPDIAPAQSHPDQDEPLTGLSSSSDGMRPSDGQASDPEALRFENEKLKRKVRELLDQLAKVETRAASLHYRAAELSEVNKRLEMGYTGANALANGLEKMVQDLRQEIERLKGAEPSSPPKRIP